MPKFIIPMDSAISQFGDHLRAYPRTMLSARFGDGKTYFLDAVRNDERLKEEFAFLTIYPINYQVMDNKDIFEIVKYDILWQLMLNKMISFDFEMTENEKIAWFIKTKTQSGNLFSGALSIIPMIGNSFPSVAIAQVAKNLKSLYNKLKKDYEKFNEQYKSEGDIVEKYLESMESKALYEHDIITSIIQRAIEKYRGKTNKKVALIIEDMDRMDPAHAFRILNVFSAHMDYEYRSFSSKQREKVDNKFSFDNIVVVADYDNLEKIFHHFYGNGTSFEGYISKFLSGNYFTYSLKSIQKEYIIKKIIEITTLPQEVIRIVLTNDNLESKSIREIVQSFDISQQIPNKPIGRYKGREFRIDVSLLKLMAIMKRLKIDSGEIVKRVLELQYNYELQKSDQKYFFYSYVGVFMLEKGMIEKTKVKSPIILVNKDDDLGRAEWRMIKGKIEIKLVGHRNNKDPQTIDYRQYVEYMLKFIV